MQEEGKKLPPPSQRERLAQGAHRKHKSVFKNCIVLGFFLFIMVREHVLCQGTYVEYKNKFSSPLLPV